VSGLTAAEVDASRAKYGKNTTPSAHKKTLLMRLWEQINGSVIYILIGAAIVSGYFKDWPDLGLIVSVIILNATIGLVQEGKAEAAAEALGKLLAAKAMVVRGGAQVQVEATEVVVGDVLYLQAGDAITADVRFFSVSNLKVRESALTGESEDVEKSLALCRAGAPLGDRKNCGFAGTTCSSGAGIGVVIAIGSTAQLGSIKTLIDEADAGDTPLQQSLEGFGRALSILTIFVAVATFFLQYYGRMDGDSNKLHEALAIAVGIAVAIIPEGLPSVVTITLAVGVRQMAAHNAIIRQLPAVETLGSVSVVCSDKTGTLTLNQMMVTRIRTATAQYIVEGQGYDPFSGDVHGTRGALRKTDPELQHALYWLALPGVIANDGGLAAPSDLARQWPSQRFPGGVATGGTGAAEGGADGDPAAAAAKDATVVRVTPTAAESALWNPAGDPTDVALLVLGHKLGITGNINTYKAEFEVVAKVPFDSDYKFVAVMTDVDTPAGRKRLVYLKGAWDELIRRCNTQAARDDAFASEPVDRAFWLEEASNYAANGMRVLAVVQWEVPADKADLSLEELRDAAATAPCLQLNCLVAIVDPCRDTAAAAVRECHGAGITVKMITGDHPDTACYIARELGIIDTPTFLRYLEVKGRTDAASIEARRCIVLKSDDLEAIPADPKESALAYYAQRTNIFARVSPLHKLRIVRALKETCGLITSMTGDGVNDAPALKEAHCGVAMGITGTDVAKQAAKMILADDMFSTIAEAVRRGRGVYDNLRKVLMFILPTNLAQGFAIVAAIVIGMDSPLTAMQVLTVNMVTSVTLGLVIALEEPEPDVMSRPPRDPRAPLLDKYVTWRTFIVTVAMVVAILGNTEWEARLGGSSREQHAIAMSTLIVAQALYCLNCRFLFASSLTPHVFVGNPWLLAMVVLNGAVQAFLVHTPGVQEVWGMASLNGLQWLRIIFLPVILFLMVEVEKYIMPRFVFPLLAPFSTWLDAHWEALSCRCACCRSRLCRALIPSPAGPVTGMPIPIHRGASPSPPSATGTGTGVTAAAHVGFHAPSPHSAHAPSPHTASVPGFSAASPPTIIGTRMSMSHRSTPSLLGVVPEGGVPRNLS